MIRAILGFVLLALSMPALASGFHVPWWVHALLWCIQNWPLIVFPGLFLFGWWLVRKKG